VVRIQTGQQANLYDKEAARQPRERRHHVHGGPGLFLKLARENR